MKNLVWIDLEMSGLDAEKERIIEVACIITSEDLKELETYQSVVKQPQSYIDNMDEWNRTTHTKSGLLEKIPHAPSPETVENEVIHLLKTHYPTCTGPIQERPILAGNSVHQDKLFIDRYFKKLKQHLHYRMLDVTALKIVFESFGILLPTKKNTHRALDDIRESIEELKFYIQKIKNLK